MKSDYISNLPEEINARPKQPLSEHCCNVSRRCGEFASQFSVQSFGKLLGLVHDWGKAAPEWQKYLTAEKGSVSHAPESAGELFHSLPESLKPFAILLGYAVYGHHSSLPDWFAGLDTVQNKNRINFKIPGVYPPVSEALEQSLISEIKTINAPEQLPFLIRMLFSALVDADRLDAESFDSPEKSKERGIYDDWSTLEARFNKKTSELEATAADSTINRVRSDIRKQCEAMAGKPRGLFSLNVPTGGGKTLSSLAFAFKHRAIHHMKRIIYAIPFNSIIEQTAHIYKDILGEGNVLEHHHNFVLPDSHPFDDLRRKYDLAQENWDMPIIVTTTVQLFESLLQGRASGSRKLHNIANSIIILDEAQKLPPEHLNAILTSLRVLIERFGCTVVLCSATIPVIDVAKIGRNGYNIQGLPEATPIIDNPEEQEEKLKRTRITMLGTQSLENVAKKMAEQPQSLCIVNTRAKCIELYNRLQVPRKYHLSASMCPADRQEILEKIRKDLKAGMDVAIVATSLIEAGVDIDVRTVFREMAGVDSIAQAAGRCNREGKFSCGEVYVFEAPGTSIPGVQTFAADAARDAIGDETHPEMNQAIYRKYFELFYVKCSPLLDKDSYSNAFSSNALQYEFRTFGEKFHLIDDKEQIPLVVLYGDAAKVIERLQNEGPSKALFHRLSPYTVTLWKRDFEKLKTQGLIDESRGVAVQKTAGIYEPGIGIQLDTLPTYQF